MSEFEINGLDHVAIRVKNLEAAIGWYENVLGLKVCKLAKWGESPIFMLAGKTGVALFSAGLNDTELDPLSKNVGIDHYAFNVTRENFIKAKMRYDKLDIDYEFKDHFYFHSIYTKDRDGHTVELTTLVVDEKSFYLSE
ncbi:VOC family protein [Maribacter algicola]|uniref:VOC family protein n=1 Tax=Meishania litoralis TaxID=3434685 RepID=A0ACC7LJ13_9FLAO